MGLFWCGCKRGFIGLLGFSVDYFGVVAKGVLLDDACYVVEVYLAFSEACSLPRLLEELRTPHPLDTRKKKVESATRCASPHVCQFRVYDE